MRFNLFKKHQDPKIEKRTLVVNSRTTPVYPPSDFLDLAKGGYEKNSTVQAGLNYLSTSFCEATPIIYKSTRTDQIVNMGQVLDNLAISPNPIQTSNDFWSKGLLHYYLSGNAYCKVIRSTPGEPVELWWLRPDRVTINPDPRTYIRSYKYQLDDGTYFSYSPEDIIHIKAPNPRDDYYGLSPLTGCVRNIASDNELIDTLKTYLQNRGIPGMAIELPADYIVIEDDIERLKIDFQAKYTGKKRGTPVVLSQGAKVHPMTIAELRTLIPIDIADLLEAKILSSIGVPPILIGSHHGMQRSTYANYHEARLSFFEDTLEPLFRIFSEVYNKQITVANVRAEFNTKNVAGLDWRNEKREERILKLLAAQVITQQEARRKLGYE